MTTAAQNHDVIDTLTTDHHEVLDPIDSIARTSGTREQRDTADTVIAEIVRHSVAEEMYVYPAMREHLPDGESQVAHDIEEHKQLERTMKDLERVDSADTEFVALVTLLREQLAHHAADEEQTQFPLLRRHLPQEVLIDLGKKVELAKSVAPTRPHPNAPNSALFHKAFGPGVGLVDKLRDALSGRADNT